ncbi:pyridoxamine 5'-phosphate oxidase family protein [Nitrococcus mobilis]|uniref:Signal transduction histidine kinase, nitrogen specific n=1 Tax=Nitrococcus mobilis Nb-231 TaxID=314278 RepID=A4BV48_9GAMM|nr:pyridoxamine 5'-phosphate oxidase family protein [Nitrococcus mobilis]EAR20390.1 Signal transduction histidine kinase, nitrogen specific [Nitrococcus mobilis Nb-231]
MAVRYQEITDRLEKFINEQKVFFVGTATADSRINISPKGLDTLRIVNKNRVVWLNVTGSGNETATHVQENPRMTLMFCAFEGKPMILRLYGKAKVIHQNDREWQDLFALFKPIPGYRQILDLSVDMALTSCGIGVPSYHYVGERDMLEDWAIRKDGEDGTGIRKYWEDKNQFSIDDIPSHIMEKNT